MLPAAGSKAKYHHAVTPRPGGAAVQLPVLAVAGSKPGRRLLVTAGVHGDEFEGMAAIYRLYDTLEAAQLSGRVVCIPIANPPAYDAGLRVNPDDRQDLARVFPGDPAGSVSEQIAHCLTNTFLRECDFYVDLHSAGQYYRMPSLVGYQIRAEPLLSAQRAAARAFGLPLVWGTPAYQGRSLSAAGDLGVPSLYAETTGEGRCRAEDVGDYVDGLRRLMKHLGMVEEAPAPQAVRWFVEDESPQAGFLQVQNRAPAGGFFAAEVTVLQQVDKGQRVGALRDALGTETHVISAPHAGLVVFLRTYSRMHAGEPVCTVLALS